MLVPIKLGTKRKMFSFVCSSSTFTGCCGVPLLWVVTRCSAAMLAEVESSLAECCVWAERSATSGIQEAGELFSDGCRRDGRSDKSLPSDQGRGGDNCSTAVCGGVF